MKIVSMTMVGNESEIIESFIRYNSNFVDEMHLILSGSIDNSIHIIRKMIKEGYSIILHDESLLSYEQRYIENKYMNFLVERGDIDIVLPLDADEFITGIDNPRKILETLNLNQVYEIQWKNYVMHPDDNYDESFIPRRITHCKQKESTIVTKTIIPAQLAKNKKIVLETGRHHVYGENVTVKQMDDLWIAHYPSISEEQYKSKLYGSSINFITWMNRGNGEGTHINRQIAQLEDAEDIYTCAYEYGYGEDINQLIIDPLELNFCKSNSLLMLYTELAKVDLQKNLITIGQLAAIRAYNLTIKDKFDEDKPVILIYGAGREANTMFNGLPKNIVNIRAYIDSNINKKFTMFNNRLVITPEFIRFFQFDKIVISSQRYFSEMRQTLMENEIEETRIEGLHYLFSLY